VAHDVTTSIGAVAIVPKRDPGLRGRAIDAFPDKGAVQQVLPALA